MTGIEWTEQDAREWLAGDCAFIDHRAVLTLLLADLDALRGVAPEPPACGHDADELDDDQHRAACLNDAAAGKRLADPESQWGQYGVSGYEL